LRDIGFFSLLEIEAPEPAQGDDQTLVLRFRSNTKVVSSEIGGEGSLLADLFAAIPGEERLRLNLYTAVLEAMQNVIDHEALTDSSMDYWLIDVPSNQPIDRSRALQEAAVKNEAKIIALQHRIAALRSSLWDDFSSHQMSVLDQAEASLFDAATGGDFGVASRIADPGRVRLVGSAAASYINSVRAGRNRYWR
jgi:hypothetical protein